jgi:hypothetical protein
MNTQPIIKKEGNPYIYGQLISEKGAKVIQWGKESFPQMGQGHVGSQVQKIKQNPILTP